MVIVILILQLVQLAALVFVLRHLVRPPAPSATAQAVVQAMAARRVLGKVTGSGMAALHQKLDKARAEGRLA